MSKKSKLKKFAESGGQVEQVAALPYRFRNDHVEFLVITSRRRKRLIVPKGWPMPGKSDHNAAAIEADEEAGVKGKIATASVGCFEYVKDIGDTAIPITATVFPLKVKRLKSDWKERKERKRRWLTAEEAASRLDDSGLRELVRQYTDSLKA